MLNIVEDATECPLLSRGAQKVITVDFIEYKSALARRQKSRTWLQRYAEGNYDQLLSDVPLGDSQPALDPDDFVGDVTAVISVWVRDETVQPSKAFPSFVC